MNLNRKLTRSTYLSCGGDSAQLRFSYSYCATSYKNRFLSSALPLPQTLQWPPHRPELPHKRCLSAFSCHSSVSDFFFCSQIFFPGWTVEEVIWPGTQIWSGRWEPLMGFSLSSFATVPWNLEPSLSAIFLFFSLRLMNSTYAESRLKVLGT